MLRPPTSTLFPYTTLFRSAPRLRDTEPRIVTMARKKIVSAIMTSSSVKARFQIGRATSELQSHSDLVCRLLLEKKNTFEQFQNAYSDMLNVSLVTSFPVLI